MMSDVDLIALWETLCKMDSGTQVHIGEVVCSRENLLDLIERTIVQMAYSQAA